MSAAIERKLHLLDLVCCANRINFPFPLGLPDGCLREEPVEESLVRRFLRGESGIGKKLVFL
jgi:hypothetical protein